MPTFAIGISWKTLGVTCVCMKRKLSFTPWGIALLRETFWHQVDATSFQPSFFTKNCSSWLYSNCYLSSSIPNNLFGWESWDSFFLMGIWSIWSTWLKIGQHECFGHFNLEHEKRDNPPFNRTKFHHFKHSHSPEIKKVIIAIFVKNKILAQTETNKIRYQQCYPKTLKNLIFYFFIKNNNHITL